VAREESTGARIHAFWVTYRGSIAWLALVVLAVLGFLRIESFAGDIRDAAVQGCQRQNKVSKEERQDSKHEVEGLQVDKRQQKAISPEFFPAIPEREFKKLIEEEIDRIDAVIRDERESIHELPKADCKALYPE
jgi:hypothetical protein